MERKNDYSVQYCQVSSEEVSLCSIEKNLLDDDCCDNLNKNVIPFNQCTSRSKIVLIICLTSLVSLVSYNIYLLFFPKWTPTDFPELFSDDFLLRTPVCVIPNWPVFDPETRHLFSPIKKPYHCKTRSNIEKQIRRINYTWIEVPKNAKKCTAIEVVREPKMEKWLYGKRRWTIDKQFTEFPDSVSVEVTCDRVSKLVLLIPKKKPLTGYYTGVQAPKYEDRTNILLFGIDSVSRLQYIRHLVRTQKILNQNNVTIFLGHHKIGLNTFPNVIPMMIGEHIDDWMRLKTEELKLDPLPLLFRDFRRDGYMTSFIEDMSNFGLFTYHEKNGFIDVPYDYFLRPASVYMDKHDSGECYKGETQSKIYSDYMFDMMKAFEERKQNFYIHSHLSILAHDQTNFVGYMDFPTSDFFEKFFSSTLKKNTLVIFYADHAIRFGRLTKTKSSFYEIKMPVFGMYIPENLRLLDTNDQWMNHRQILKTVVENSRRLTNQFDVHATLNHILHKTPTTSEKFGQSLFTPISVNRTCESSGIPFEYCACHHWKTVENPRLVQKLGGRFLNEINSIIEMDGKGNKCEVYTLKSILKAEFLEDNKIMSYMMSIETMPGNCIFKARIDEDGRILGDIERLDMYREKSQCVANTNLETMCFCRN